MMKDSGKREEFATGAVRDTQEGKGRFDLVSMPALWRLAKWYELGAIKYAPHNWEKGIPVSRCLSAAFRHLAKWAMGWKDEDHLAAAAWNIFAIMHFEELGRTDLMDMPWHQNKPAETFEDRKKKILDEMEQSHRAYMDEMEQSHRAYMEERGMPGI